MDDDQLQEELEALAGNAFNPDFDNGATKPEAMIDTICRWQKLFRMSQGEAVDRIMDHRNNLTRARISEAHWDMIRSQMESNGYDREAYEFELELQKKEAALPGLLPSAEGAEGSSVTYLVEMNGPLDSPEKVQRAAEMRDMPSVVSGKSLEEDRAVLLCCIDGNAKASLLRWCACEGGGFEPAVLVNPKSLQ